MKIPPRFDVPENRRTKIIATLGPASSDEVVLERLIEQGVNIVRLNMSHGTHETHQQAFERVCALREHLDIDLAVLADLCGPRMRTGCFQGGGAYLAQGEEVIVSVKDGEGGDGIIVSRYRELVDDVVGGDRILLADGLFELRVLDKGPDEVRCKVVQGGRLRDNMGINLPCVKVSAPSMTEKDHRDAEFALGLGVDFIALSFVRTGEDVRYLRRVIDAHGPDAGAGIVAKIEKPEALENADDILDAADAIMVARGDLGVELPPEQVPGAQVRLIRLAAEKRKPVVVATQMLESMIVNSRPTRAEVTDVSHAVNDRVDAVMLSAETAVGRFPAEAAAMMDRIARQTEMEKVGGYSSEGPVTASPPPPVPLWNVIAETTARMSRDLPARAVMVLTRSGRSAQIVSTARPLAPIIAVTGDPRVCRKLAINWGVMAVHEPLAGKVNPSKLVRELALKLGLGKKGQYILLVRGIHGEQVLNLPSVTVVEI